MSNHNGVNNYSNDFERALRERLSYDENTGKFYWKYIEPNRPTDYAYNSRFAGKEAGSVKKGKNRDGYVEIHVQSRMLKAHRLAWWWVYGEWPVGELDHINHKRGDNRISNLRLVDRKTQNKNASKRKDNTSGYCGVTWHKRYNKWVAQIFIDGKNKSLGYYDNIQDAVAVRLEAEAAAGFSKTHGKKHNIYHEDSK